MATYEFLVNNNYGKRTVPEHPANEVAAVCCQREQFRHVQWSGTIELSAAKRLVAHESNVIACFMGGGAYREVGAFSWEHPPFGQSLIGLVGNTSVLAITASGIPFLHNLGDVLHESITIIEPTTYKPKALTPVAAISSYRR